jgi:hypothetical protein
MESFAQAERSFRHIKSQVVSIKTRALAAERKTTYIKGRAKESLVPYLPSFDISHGDNSCCKMIEGRDSIAETSIH